jgi:thymidylate synthase ThyX
MDVEQFTADEQTLLRRYFTNTDQSVFALRNLPETTKGALFARYSRSAKSLRRLFLDEFLGGVPATPPEEDAVGLERANRLYANVLSEYGDDSVAQLASAHVACEGVSNVLTKVLERGRLMSYLEQSTRYVPYTGRPDGRWKYHVPVELDAEPVLRARYVEAMDLAFETYGAWLPRMEAWYEARFPKSPADTPGVYKSTIRAKALDTLRGLLPAATQSNVGVYGSGQAYEGVILRLRASPLAEARACGEAMLCELRKVIPAFLTRLDVPERGGAWVEYLAAGAQTVAGLKEDLGADPGPAEEGVELTDYDPDGETKVLASVLFEAGLPDAEALRMAAGMPEAERGRLLRGYAGNRLNRRHKPGRAFERTSYRFEVVADYGAFRDLQRHRLLTIDWQPLSARLGQTVPAELKEAGGLPDWERAMDRSAQAYEAMLEAGLGAAAQYAVCMAYRVRFVMQMNAREAMHLIELRTSPQGHPSYRRVCHEMHRLIAEQAGHQQIAAAMRFVDYSDIDLERLEAERRSERRRLAIQ